jgi:hypothetical protein
LIFYVGRLFLLVAREQCLLLLYINTFYRLQLDVLNVFNYEAPQHLLDLLRRFQVRLDFIIRTENDLLQIVIVDCQTLLLCYQEDIILVILFRCW